MILSGKACMEEISKESNKMKQRLNNLRQSARKMNPQKTQKTQNKTDWMMKKNRQDNRIDRMKGNKLKPRITLSHGQKK